MKFDGSFMIFPFGGSTVCELEDHNVQEWQIIILII
jgi:hypothetical protein